MFTYNTQPVVKLTTQLKMHLQLPSELENIIWDLVRVNLRPRLKARLWYNVHSHLRFVVKVPNIRRVFRFPKHRDQETGEILFDYEDTFSGTRHKVPITTLMDINNQVFYYEIISKIVKDWTIERTFNPRAHWGCICCDQNAVQQSLLCSTCIPMYHNIVYSE